MFIFGYIVSIVASYFLFRLYYKNDKDAWANPHYLNIFVMLIPIINLGVPSLLYLTTIEFKVDFNYKKFFFLKQEKEKL